MNFFEAMKALEEGKQIRLKSWPSDEYIELMEEEARKNGKRIVKYTVLNECGLEISPCLSFSALVKSDWELFDNEIKNKIAKKLQELIFE